MVGVEGRLSVELPLPIADALRRWKCLQQRCRYLQREQRNVEHCCAQRRSRSFFFDIAAESRIGDIRGRHRFVVTRLRFDLLLPLPITDALCRWKSPQQFRC